MKILAVDDDKTSLDRIKGILEKTIPDAECYFFDSSLSALAKAREEEIDVAFLDVKMPELNGIDLGKYLTELNPYVNLIYISEHTDYAYEAMRIHASGYIRKPGTGPEVQSELKALRFPELRKKYKRVFIQTFGNFEIFCDKEPVEFKYKRTNKAAAEALFH